MALDSDTAASSDQAGWALYAQRPGDKEMGLSHEIAYIRKVASDEIQAIEAGRRLFLRFGSNWGWTKVETAVRGAFGYFEAANATFRAARAVNQTDFLQIDRALRGIADDVERWISELNGDAIEGADSARLEQLRIDVNELETGSATKLARQLGSLPATAVLAEPVISSGTPPKVVPIVAPTALALIETSNPARHIRVDELLAMMIGELEPLAAQWLIAHNDLLTNTCARFMRLGAEAIYGTPALMPDAVRDQLAAGGGGKLTLTPIPIGDVQTMMRALQAARQVAREFEKARSGRVGPGSTVAPPSVAPTAPKAEVPGDEATEGSVTVTRPADMIAMSKQASELADSIEQQWSDALKQAEKVSRDLFSQWASVAHALRDSTSVQAERLKSLGFDSTVSFPVDATFIDAIEIHPTPEQAVRQLFIGELYAVTSLLDAMNGLKAPTARAVDLTSGASRSWWESGIFALVRARARIAIEVDRELDALSRGIDGATERTWIEELRTAQLCLSSGLPEAAVIYLHRTVGKLQVAFAAEAKTSDGPPLKESFVRKLREISQMIVEGKDTSYGAILPVVNFGISETQKFVRGQMMSRLPRPSRTQSDAVVEAGEIHD